MRIIAGKFKGKKIYTIPGNTTRPTSDFIREMLFSTLFSLQPSFENTLDLFAGSGSLGFESLSRGAFQTTFVEMSQKAIDVLFENIKILNCEAECKIIKKRVEVFLSKTPEQKFDLIFLDPPYDKDIVNNTLSLIYQNNFLNDNGIIITEHSKDEHISLMYTDFIIKEKTSGLTSITFLSGGLH